MDEAVNHDELRERFDRAKWAHNRNTGLPVEDDDEITLTGDVVKYAVETIDGLESDLDAALAVIYRHGDAEARTWLFLNYPAQARAFASS